MEKQSLTASKQSVLSKPAQDEIKALIREGDGFMSKTLVLGEQGKTPSDIASLFGHLNDKAARNFAYSINILTGLSPMHPGRGDSQQAYYAAKRLLKGRLSQESRAHLEQIVIGYYPENPTPIPTAHNWPPSLNMSGVYAYSYPHYLKYPFSPEDGRTLIKVGHSGSSVSRRLEVQMEQTSVPEDLELLRVYPAENSKEMEQKFQTILEVAGHKHETATGGTEWFLTDTAFLDAIATALGLRSANLDQIR